MRVFCEGKISKKCWEKDKMKLKFCKTCKKYTLKEICKDCKEKTSEAHYKFKEKYLKR